DDDAAVDSPPTQLELVRRRLAYGTVVEFAQEFWSRKQIGARLVVGVHSHIAPVPVYDPDADIDESQLYNSLRVGVDVMKGVGSR
ncbi:MAG: hypothetical protein VX000_02360, partial [Myxococcota bacterium]|nr:hypothetical protein [Myxococcota bacterium]